MEMEVNMKNKEIKQRYKQVINNLKINNNCYKETNILKIESIENEFCEYNKKIIKDKVELGTFFLLELIIASVGIMGTSINTNNFIQEIFKNFIVTILLGLGIIPMPKIIYDYKKERFNSNIEANNNLEEYEYLISTLKTKDKVNVKKR